MTIANHLISYASSLVILGFALNKWIPSTLNQYGFRYFGWVKKRRTPCFKKMMAFWGIGFFVWFLSDGNLSAKPAYTLILVSLLGIAVLDFNFKLIPNRFHITGFIGSGWILYLKDPTGALATEHSIYAFAFPTVVLLKVFRMYLEKCAELVKPLKKAISVNER